MYTFLFVNYASVKLGSILKANNFLPKNQDNIKDTNNRKCHFASFEAK